MKPRPLLFPLALLFALLLQTPGCGESPATGPATLTIKDKPFTLEIADTPALRERGLMHRKSLPKDAGMIFIMDEPGQWGFWMKNTLIDLDLLWLNDAGEIVHLDTLRALDETPHANTRPARFIIELNAGTAKNLALKTGDKIALPPKLLKAATTQPDK